MHALVVDGSIKPEKWVEIQGQKKGEESKDKSEEEKAEEACKKWKEEEDA